MDLKTDLRRASLIAVAYYALRYTRRRLPPEVSGRVRIRIRSRAVVVELRCCGRLRVVRLGYNASRRDVRIGIRNGVANLLLDAIGPEELREALEGMGGIDIGPIEIRMGGEQR